MTEALALAQIAMWLLPNVTIGVRELVYFINSVRNAAIQTNEWTPAMEASWKASIVQDARKPAQQPDKD